MSSPSKGANALNDPKERQKFKSALATITHYLEIIDQQKEGIKETIADISDQYGVDKKLIRKLANTMYKANFGTIQEENEHFTTIYEMIIGGKVTPPVDPLDND